MEALSFTNLHSRPIEISFLKNAFIENSFSECISFSDRNNLKLHWADSLETCRLIQHNIKNRGVKYNDFKFLLSHLEELRSVPVWVKGERGVKQFTLYDLYHSIVLPERFHLKTINVDKNYDISLVGPSGPYKNVHLRTWINQKDYLDIVYKNILNGTLSPREFRVRVEGKILCHYLSGKNTCVLNVKQITKDGILFSTRELNFYDHLENTKELQLLLDLSIFNKNLHSDLNEIQQDFSEIEQSLFFTHEEQNVFQVNLNATHSYMHYTIEDSQFVKTHFLFIPFHAFSDAKINLLKQFVQNLHNRVKYLL
jgi:hypothetical protein